VTRKLTALIVAFIAALIVAICSPATGDDANRRKLLVPDQEWRIISQNIAGGAMHNGDASALAEVQFHVNGGFRAQIVLMQEVCGSQLTWFKNRHPDWDVYGVVSRVAHPNCPGVDPDLYDVVASSAHQTAETTVHLYDDGVGGRTGDMPCATIHVWQHPKPVRACSAHFPTTAVSHDPDGAKYASAVTVTMAHLETYMQQGLPTVFGGDLNREPNESEVAPFYSRMVEVDDPENENTTGGALPANGRKIDYIFFKHFIGWDVKVGDAYSGRVSDHRLLKGRITDNG
jgi:Endonuclease/Exonuclease/phosphatase family